MTYYLRLEDVHIMLKNALSLQTENFITINLWIFLHDLDNP